MKRPPFETFKEPTCRGSYALNSACGRCERCAWERDQMLAPSIVWSPEAEADVAKLVAEHPEAKEILAELSANILQAMQAFKDGRYSSFEDALEAITGIRPEPIE